jgi:thiamine-phosphate pyrophosphorylase
MSTISPPLPRLFIVSSGREHADAAGLALRQAGAIGAAPPAMFQLREKGLDAASLYGLCRTIAPLLSGSGSLLLVNERADVALASAAAGVHLPDASCPADAIRRSFPPLLAGKSVHSVKSAVEAAKSGLHYLLFGPVFATPSKERFGPPQGLDLLGEVCGSVPIPVFAVGGITPERSIACIEKGAWGIAALTPFLDIDALPRTMETYRSYLPS